MHPDLQYVADTVFIESMAKDLCNKLELNKQASVLDSIGLSSVAGTISEFVKENLNIDGGIGKGIGEILLTGAIFRVHPLLGIINAVASAVGFGLTDVISYIYKAIKSTLDAGGKVSADQIQRLAREATTAEVGPLEAEANNDPFYFIKTAYGYSLWDNVKVMPGGKESFWTKLLGGTWYKDIGRKKVSWFLGGIAAWLVTTVLFGAGLMAGSSALTGALGIGKNKKQETKSDSTTVSPNSSDTKPTKSPVKKEVGRDTGISNTGIRDTGFGKKKFPNDISNMWVVPIYMGLKNQLLDWTFAAYPDLEKIENEISSLPSFNKTLYELERNYKPSDPKRLIMPQRYHSLREVIDTFSADAFKIYFSSQ